MSMELIMSPANVEITQGIANKEYLKNELACQLEYYKNLDVTEENMKSAKADRATLNKLRTAIDDQRKTVKKQVETLYKPFENDCKELITMIDEPIAAIDTQLKTLDVKKRQEKFKEIEKFFDQVNCLPFVKLEHVLDPKWGNATMKLDKIKDGIAGEVERISDDYAEIRTLYADSPMLTAILQRFEQTRDKGAALAYATEIERKEKAEQERREREAAAAEAQRKAIEESDIPYPSKFMPAEPEQTLVQKTVISSEDMVVKTIDQSEPMITGTFRVTGTKAQIIALREFLKANGLDFEIVR